MRRFPFILVIFLTALPASAQIRIGTTADGRLVLHNDSRDRGPAARRGFAAAPSTDLAALIERHAVRQDLDPLLVRSLIEVESGYDVRAVSIKGAMGLMQLMPDTARELAVADPFDPDANIRGGTEYLRRMLDSFDGVLTLALAGYNAGPEAVRRHGGVPPYAETREYVRRVLRLYQGADFVDFPESVESPGRRTFLVRRGGRLLMTTTPPDRR